MCERGAAWGASGIAAWHCLTESGVAGGAPSDAPARVRQEGAAAWAAEAPGRDAAQGLAWAPRRAPPVPLSGERTHSWAQAKLSPGQAAHPRSPISGAGGRGQAHSSAAALRGVQSGSKLVLVLG